MDRQVNGMMVREINFSSKHKSESKLKVRIDTALAKARRVVAEKIKRLSR